MRHFKPTREYKCTKFSSMNPDIFKELFWKHMEKCARKYYANQKKIYTVESMTMNGKVVNDLEPIVANNMYEFVAKLRAKLREIANMELYSHELVMDIVDEYVEEEHPDLKISLENIIENYLDDFYDGTYQYAMKLKIAWYGEGEADDEGEAEDEGEDEADDYSDTDSDSETDSESHSEAVRIPQCRFAVRYDTDIIFLPESDLSEPVRNIYIPEYRFELRHININLMELFDSVATESRVIG